MSASRLRDYFLLEARHAPIRAPLAMMLWGIAAVFGTHALMLRLPERVIRFLEQAFRLEGIAAVFLINDIVAAYFVTFFVGMMGLLRAVVSAREEDQLELLLAKPVSPQVFLAARVWPVLAGSLLAGLATAVTTALAIRPYLAAGERISAAGALGSGLFLVALGILLLCALLPLLVRTRDSFLALLIGSFVWLVPAIPGAVFIYRPDLFDSHPTMRETIVLATLLWHDATAAWLGPLALAFALPVGALLVVVAGRVLEKIDVR